MRWYVRSMNQINQAWPTKLLCRSSSSLELTSTLCFPSISRQQFRSGLKTQLFKEAYTDDL